MRRIFHGSLFAATMLALLAFVACSPASSPPARTPASGARSNSSAAPPRPGTMGSQFAPWARKGIKIPSPPKRPAAPVSILGADVSEWQGWTNLGAYNRGFIVIREQYGTAGLDLQFVHNRDQARSLGLPRAFYHYAYPQYNSAESEAATFANGTDWQAGEGAVLDFEESYGDPVGWSLRFLQTFEQLRGFKPLLYVNVYTLYAYNWGAVAGNGNGLWAAQWNYNLSEPASGAFPFAAAKQYTDHDSVPGIAGGVDGDVFYGDQAAFERYGYAGGGSAPANPPAPEPAPVSPPSNGGGGDGGCIHVVQSGETLSGIVGGRWPQVAAANGLRNANLIFPGEQINTCASGSTVVSGGGGATGCVVVRRGDTLSGLFGSRWPTVARRNGLRNPNLIFPGQRICA